VLEKEEAWARHQSGHNSGVIHSGIYYKPGSLKAKLCRKGNARMRQFCEDNAIPFELCGKLIVATKRSELPMLAKLFQRGVANGLEVRQLDETEVRKYEPHVRCIRGLHVPTTGIVNYAEVCAMLAKLSEDRDADLRLRSEVKAIRVLRDEVIVETDEEVISGDWIVNCAGLHSDQIAVLAGAKPDVRIVPFRGEYYELRPERRNLVRNLIYPVPDPEFPFLGVHFTRMLDGSVHAGPNAVLSLKREGYRRTEFDWEDLLSTMRYPGFWRFAANHFRTGIREMHRSFSKGAFVRSLQELIPEVREEDLIPTQGGVRAQALTPAGKLVDDFMIVGGPRATHVCNAPSPAATASLEIGGMIAEAVLNRSEVVPV